MHTKGPREATRERSLHLGCQAPASYGHQQEGRQMPRGPSAHQEPWEHKAVPLTRWPEGRPGD